jgi:hypothetical protein
MPRPKKTQQPGNLQSDVSVPLDEVDEINNDFVGDTMEVTDEAVLVPKPHHEEVVMMVSDTEVIFTIQNN